MRKINDGELYVTDLSTELLVLIVTYISTIGNNSPYMAIILAYKMGCKKIGMLGVDFTPNHFYAKDGDHDLIQKKYINKILNHYELLYNELKKNDCLLYNLSVDSIITTVPKILPEEF